MRVTIATALLAAGLAAMPVAALAQAPAAPVPAAPVPTGAPDPAAKAEAMKLAQLLNSDAIIVGDDKSDRKALEMMRQIADASPEIAALEKDYPGIIGDMARAMLPIVNRSARARLPQLWDRQTALYAANFTAVELRTLIAFYTSPTGVKLITGLQENLKPNAMIAEAVKSTDFTITAPSAMADIQATVPDIMKTMNADDQRVLIGLARSGLLGRLKALAPQTQTIALTWMNETTPTEDAETDAAIDAIVQKRIAKADK